MLEHAYPYQVVVIGGDARQIEVASALSSLFKKVKVFGHPPFILPDTVEIVSDLPRTLAEAKITVLPISGMNDAGLVRSCRADEFIDFGNYVKELTENSLIVTGQFTPKWLKKAVEMRINVLEYADNDEIAILNSIPTAEGAVQIAMEELPITIHGSTVVVIGFGRVGMTTARLFKSLGARVIVSARRQALLARAIELCCETVLHQDLAGALASADIIINTVPDKVLSAHELAKLSSEALIIDLASPPGGTDFEEAKRLKLKAILAPGLPGKVAPKTAGKILANTIPKLIVNYLNGGDGK